VNVLVYGIGNPGRQDDGLGSALVDVLQQRLEPRAGSGCGDDIRFDANYQLNIEDAEAISHCDVVVFADASLDDRDGPFRISRLKPEPGASFTTHSVSPGGVLALCREVYGVEPTVYLVAMKGYEWEMGAPLSDLAAANLAAAADLLTRVLCDSHVLQQGQYSLLDEFLS